MTDTDVIGIEFEFTRSYEDHLVRLFKGVPIEKYTWYVSCSENYGSKSNEKAAPFLPDGIYSGAEFSSIIHSIPYHYINLIRLLAIPSGKDFDPDKINVYEDFQESATEIALLSADSIVSLYIKDRNILDTVFESCKLYYDNSAIVPTLITPQNDGRTRFWV